MPRRENDTSHHANHLQRAALRRAIEGDGALVACHPAHPVVYTVMPTVDVLEHQVFWRKRFDRDLPLEVLDYEAHPWPA
jgi:hypothetical protein